MSEEVELIYKDNKCSFEIIDRKCFLMTEKNTFNVSGHPYEPCIYINDIQGNNMITINGKMFLPEITDPPIIWKAFCERLLEEIKVNNY